MTDGGEERGIIKITRREESEGAIGRAPPGLIKR